jgi:hypothetical protein
MELKEVSEKAIKELQAVMNLEVSSVTGVSKVKDDGWQVTVELIERKAVPDTQDLLGLYEVHLDDDGHLISFERKRVRHRIDIIEETLE